MAPEKATKTKATKHAPKTVADFTVLQLVLPTSSSLPEQCKDAKHYIYVKPHAPSVPTATDERSLFIANVPIDATEGNMRALFAEQLGGSMVERVEFDATIPAQPMHKRWKTDKPGNEGGEKRGKKRKRNEEALVAEGVVEDAESALPSIWPGKLRRSGSGAVVIFVDKRSARGAMKEVYKAVKDNKSIHWKSGDAALGVERMFRPQSAILPKTNANTRIPPTQQAYLPDSYVPPKLSQRLPLAIQHPRDSTQQTSKDSTLRARRRRLRHRHTRRSCRARTYRGCRKEEGRARGQEEEERSQRRLLPVPKS